MQQTHSTFFTLLLTGGWVRGKSVCMPGRFRNQLLWAIWRVHMRLGEFKRTDQANELSYNVCVDVSREQMFQDVQNLVALRQQTTEVSLHNFTSKSQQLLAYTCLTMCFSSLCCLLMCSAVCFVK